MKLNATKIDTYLSKLSSPKPTPGGGSASAVVAGLGIGLGEMVANVILSRKTKVKNSAQLRTVSKKLAQLRTKTEEIIDKDATIYARLHAAYTKKSKVNEGEIANCLYASFDVMALLASLVLAAQHEVIKIEKYKGSSLMNDLILSKEFLAASFKGAYATAKINCDYMPEKKRKQAMQSVLKVLHSKFKGIKPKSVR